jgi:archaellum component FlaF (FlaF/FlaG flagellin family)
MFMKRRGVSEIISTIIIILIVSVSGSLLFAYSSGFFQEQQDSILRESELSVSQAEERVKVSTILWNGVDDDLNIAVYNYGKGDLAINDIYVNGVRVQIYTSGRHEVILTNKIKRIIFTSPVTITLGESYTINIVTSNGVSKIDNWEAE